MANGESIHMKLAPTLLVAFAIGALFTLNGCSNDSPSANTPTDSISSQAAPDELDKMATVFQGGHTRDQIQSVLDQAMSLYGTPINEDGYRRCGSVLVEMTNDKGMPEMDLLNYMIRIKQAAPGGGMTFADGAALAAWDLSRKPN
ncbi:MAG: hypothetical protein ACRYFS_15280 [Janthinobacterium lividum]